MQWTGELAVRIRSLGNVVEACAGQSGSTDLSAAIAQWVHEEVDALMARAWDDGWAAAMSEAPQVPLPQPL